MNKLTDKPHIKRVRLWGKIFGTMKDYYILYGEKIVQLKDDPDPSVEQDTEGVNQISFWVANDPTQTFIELPPVKPEHIKIAKQIKVLFTGNLEQEIKSLPQFPGDERHYLKAQ